MPPALPVVLTRFVGTRFACPNKPGWCGNQNLRAVIPPEVVLVKTGSRNPVFQKALAPGLRRGDGGRDGGGYNTPRAKTRRSNWVPTREKTKTRTK